MASTIRWLGPALFLLGAGAIATAKYTDTGDIQPEAPVEQQAEFESGCVGRTLAVLIEKPGRHPGQMVGRSPYLQAVHLDCDTGLTGRIVEAEITSAGPNSLAGRRVVA